MEQYADLEARLRQYKYQHGQDRAEVQRMHEKLSQAQRSLGTARLKASKAGDDLRDFDCMLKKALETKRRIIAHHRNKTAKLDLLRSRLETFERLKQEAQLETDAAKQECEQVKQQEASLRQSMRDRTAELQEVAEETAQIRSENSRLEHDLDAKLKLEGVVKQRMEALKKQRVDSEAQQKSIVETNRKNAATAMQSMQELEQKIKYEQETISKETASLRHFEQQITQIQISEKHIAPTEKGDSRAAKPLDARLIRASEEAEAKALADEETAKASLEVSIGALRQQLRMVEEEDRELGKKANKKQAALKEAKHTEETRRKDYQEFIAKLEAAGSEVETLEKSLAEQQKLTEKRIAELQEKSGGLRMAIFKAKARVGETKEKLEATNGKVEKVCVSYEDTKRVDGAKVEKAKQKLASLRQKHAKLASEADEKEKELANATHGGIPGGEEPELPTDEIKAEIAKILDGTLSRGP
jgi:chromosome segregation ATPase